MSLEVSFLEKQAVVEHILFFDQECCVLCKAFSKFLRRGDVGVVLIFLCVGGVFRESWQHAVLLKRMFILAIFDVGK